MGASPDHTSASERAIGDTVESQWRPKRPVKVDERICQAVTRFRAR